MASKAIQTDALPYIDVTPPYIALQNLQLVPTASPIYPTISATFTREQPPPPQNANSFCASELGRHTAILGSVAAAYSNPDKKKHYYLALDALADFVAFPVSQVLRAEARIVSAAWAKRRVSCEVQTFTLAGAFAGRLQVSYAILTEPQLLQAVKPMDPKLVLGTPWQAGEGSPYEDPIMLRMVKLPNPDLATAIISLHNVRSMAGHFSPRAAAPIAILSSNAIALCRWLLDRGGGERSLDNRTRVRCRRLVVAGEVLEVKAKRLREGDFTHRVEFWDEGGKMVGVTEHLFTDVAGGKSEARL